MSQYKSSMERMNPSSDQDTESIHQQVGEPGEALVGPLLPQQFFSDSIESIGPLIQQDSSPPSSAIAFLERHASIILMPTIPILWCILFLCTVTNRQSLLSSWGMPFLGIGSATLANAVPVGGGIVFVPILSLFGGIDVQLGASFAVATMSFGNGVFGLLAWLKKDPKALYDAWYVIPYAVFPAWIGATIGIMRPLMSPEQCRMLFALYAIIVAALVWWGLLYNKRGGDNKVFTLSDCGDNCDGSVAEFAKQQSSTPIIASLCSFLAGIILVAHIGIGNAMTTFLVSTYIWKLTAKSSVVVSIIVGGWTSILPFVLHLVVLQDVPIVLWVMGLPGVYLGARIAPLAHERIGIVNVLAAFVLFLIVMAVLMIEM